MRRPEDPRALRQARRQQRAKYQHLEALGRRLREAWPERLGHLTAGAVIDVVLVGLRHARPRPRPGNPGWGHWVRARQGQQALQRRLAGAGVSVRDYMAFLARRSHGRHEPGLLLAPPRSSMGAAAMPFAPDTSRAPSVEQRERLQERNARSQAAALRRWRGTRGDPPWLVRR